MEHQRDAGISSIASGNYQLSITDALGCEQILDFVIGEHSIDYQTAVEDVSCFGFSDGSIIIENPDPAWSFSLNDGVFTNNSIMSGLPSLGYFLTIQDEFGCTYEDQFFINQPPPVIVDVIQDTVIELGQDIFLLSNNNWNDQLDYLWLPGESLDCDNCIVPTATPNQTTVYQVIVTNDKGCTATDEVEIVVQSGQVFIPNAFTPDNNGSNDIFLIYGDQSVAQVLDFRIFSRWGEVVFSATNFQPNDPQFGWDGTFQGDNMDPAVFVYYALVEFKDGRQELFKGDVTLAK